MQRILTLIVPLLLSFLSASAASADQPQRFLFDEPGSTSISGWRIVNDGVMGGRSTSKVDMFEGERQMRFSGTLSLENNGGFASVRSTPAGLGLERGDVIVLRVMGDGRKYNFNLYVPSRRMAFSYRTDFQTTANQWVEIRLPLDRFEATSFGRRMSGVRLDPSQVNSIGILLGDKKPGPFNMVVDWIKIERS